MRRGRGTVLLLLLGAAACTDGAGSTAADGVWRYSGRESDGVRYAGAISIAGGAGVHQVTYALRGTPTRAEFNVSARVSDAGVVFAPTSAARLVVPGNASGYSPDTFNCRWAGPGALSCVSVDFNGRGTMQAFPVTR